MPLTQGRGGIAGGFGFGCAFFAAAPAVAPIPTVAAETPTPKARAFFVSEDIRAVLLEGFVDGF
jgi:hypothetical protein